MKEKEIKVGTEVVFDGCRWGIVEAIDEDGHLIVIDQDGGDHDLAPGRVDSFN
jgi:preprotein translocase subunit YajC